MVEEILGTTIRAHCGRCGGSRNCDIKGFHNEFGSEANGQFQWQTAWYLLLCRGCDYIFAQSVSTDSESYYDYYDYNNERARDNIETIETWPARARRPLPDWFENHHIEGSISETAALSAALNELYRALDTDLMVLSSIGIRTAFDAASEALGIEPGLPFAAKLNALVVDSKIRESEKESLTVLIDAGGAAAHRGWQPTPMQIDVQMDILEDFIFNSLVLPARNKKNADNIAQLKQAVPARKKPEKKPRNPTTKS